MNKILYVIAAATAILAVACKKDKVDPVKPNITWESNARFDPVEWTNSLDAIVKVTAPAKFQELKLVLNLGAFNTNANPYIQLSANVSKQSGKNGFSNPILDLIDDPKSISFAKTLGLSVGSSLKNRAETTLNLKEILGKILDGQQNSIPNNTTFSIEIRVKDQNGSFVSKTARLHFTAAPSMSWPNNEEFAVVDLDAADRDCKVSVWVPGLIEKLTVTLEDGAAPALVTYVKNRTTGATTVIDLVGDEKVVDSFKGAFPAGNAVSGKDQAVLDFGFMFEKKYDLEPSTNVFTIVAEDKNGKTVVNQAKFKKN